MKKHHAYDGTLRQFVGECRQGCHCLHYHAPVCVCGHESDAHASARLECWARVDHGFCACEVYHAASQNHLRIQRIAETGQTPDTAELIARERRQAQRLRLARPMASTIDDVVGLVIELSPIGCQVEHRRPVTRNGAVRLSLRSDRATIDLPAVIVRSRPLLIEGVPCGYQSGLAFRDVDENAALTLASFLQTATCAV